MIIPSTKAMELLVATTTSINILEQVMIIKSTKAMELVETTTSINIGAGSDNYKYKGCGAAGGDYNQYQYPGGGGDHHF